MSKNTPNAVNLQYLTQTVGDQLEISSWKAGGWIKQEWGIRNLKLVNYSQWRNVSSASSCHQPSVICQRLTQKYGFYSGLRMLHRSWTPAQMLIEERKQLLPCSGCLSDIESAAERQSGLLRSHIHKAELRFILFTAWNLLITKYHWFKTKTDFTLIRKSYCD